MTSRAYKIEITTNDLGLLSAESSGLSQSVQAVRAIVTYAGESRSYVVVVSSSLPFVLEGEDDALQSLFPNDVVSPIRAEAPGAATISCRAKSERERWEAAAVVATIKRSWGWDESPVVRVTLEDGCEFALNPVFHGGAWWVEETLVGP